VKREREGRKKGERREKKVQRNRRTRGEKEQEEDREGKWDGEGVYKTEAKKCECAAAKLALGNPSRPPLSVRVRLLFTTPLVYKRLQNGQSPANHNSYISLH